MFLFSLMIDRIGHSRIAPATCFKARLNVREVLHLSSFPKWGFLELGNDLLLVDTLDDDSHPSGSKAPNSKSSIIAVLNISVNRKLYYLFAPPIIRLSVMARCPLNGSQMNELNRSTHCLVARSTELFAYYPLFLERKRIDELELCYFQVFCSD